jgi:hypothetical protein
MKKRILLSLVSFFAMTAMWASLIDAYQIYPTVAATAKTGGTAEITLNMKNKSAIGIWQCTLVLPAGVTYESVAVVPGRYPDGYDADLVATPNADGTVTFACGGADGVALTGTDGAIATVTVKIAADAPLGDAIVTVTTTKLYELNGTIHQDEAREATLTIEQGEQQGKEGDLNDDDKVDIADAVTVLNVMAAIAQGTQDYEEKFDLNKDGKIDIADFVTVLNIMAQGAQ